MAQDAPGAAAEGAGAVDAHVRRGRKARDAGRWSEAEAAYRAALVSAGSASITDALRAENLGELGLCELALRKYRDAAEHLTDSLAHRAVLSPRSRQRFDEGRSRAEKHIVRLYLSVNPADAEVWIDGVRIATSASNEIFLEPGKHTVRVRKDGYGQVLETIIGSAGGTHSLSPVLSPAPQVIASPLSSPAGVPERHPAAVVEGGDGSVAKDLRVAGIVLTAATAVAGGAAIAWGAFVHDDIVERRAELLRDGWDPAACQRPRPATECSDLQERAARRDLLTGFGLASLVTSGAIGVVTLASFGLAQDGADSGGNGSTVRVVGVAGQAPGVIVVGTW